MDKMAEADPRKLRPEPWHQKGQGLLQQLRPSGLDPEGQSGGGLGLVTGPGEQLRSLSL